ncbi:hypothetical protein CRG98_018772 [Punica granatum]|uniref:G-patch domain-containing protein n=1 Tax=Punica granatum TaxID=22663 RepID=A0A2I0JX21_PUNGR|nr:hypothetical protein CRG98_018772 [Punica granatum]
MAGKQVDLGIKFGRLEGPTKGRGEESSKKTLAEVSASGGRRGKEVLVNAVNLAHLGPQPYSVNFKPVPPAIPTYTPPASHYQPQPPAQSIYYSAPPTPLPACCLATRYPPLYPYSCSNPAGTPRHTLDNCWRLREKIQEMIDANKLSFNAIRPPNVQANPLPDHGSSVGPSINMISIYTVGEDESEQDDPSPFVIEYIPMEATIEITEVYENPEAVNKEKAPATVVGAMPDVTPIPLKKVTEEEAEAFMKIIKASEYKVVKQMAKSPAHVSLLALLLCSEPHREALLRVLMAAQVPKETAPDMIEETVNSIFSNTISFSDDELPSEGWAHSRALHIVYVVSCSFSVTLQVLYIPNAFCLLLGRPWIHSAGAIPSSLHQRLKFIVEEKLITVKGEEDYAIDKETTIPYISIRDDENLPFHSFETISVIRDYGKVGLSRADRMIGKVLLRSNYVPSTGLGARGQGISRTIEVEEYKNMRGLGFRPSCHEIVEARRGNHLHRLAAHYGKINRSIPVPPLSHFFPGPPRIVGDTLDGLSSDFDNASDALPVVYTVTEEIPLGLHLNPNLRRIDSNPSKERLKEPGPIYFGEGLDEDGRVPEIEESLRRLEDRQLTSVEPTEEINVGTKEEPRILKIGTGLDPTQRAQMIDFLTEYQEVFAWFYADMPGLDPSIVKHFLLLDTEKFPPKRQQLRRQRSGLLLRIKEEVVKQINAGFPEVYN